MAVVVFRCWRGLSDFSIALLVFRPGGRGASQSNVGGALALVHFVLVRDWSCDVGDGVVCGAQPRGWADPRARATGPQPGNTDGRAELRRRGREQPHEVGDHREVQAQWPLCPLVATLKCYRHPPKHNITICPDHVLRQGFPVNRVFPCEVNDAVFDAVPILEELVQPIWPSAHLRYLSGTC